MQNVDGKVVVITGAWDKAFCAGGDLGGASGGGPLALHQDRGRFVEYLADMQESLGGNAADVETDPTE